MPVNIWPVLLPVALIYPWCLWILYRNIPKLAYALLGLTILCGTIFYFNTNVKIAHTRNMSWKTYDIPETFRIARMCMMIRIITLLLLALPVLFVLSAIFGRALLITPTILLVAIYSWVWLRFRPTQFVVRQDVLEVIWPLKRRQISRDSISDVRIVNGRDLKPQVGWAMRVGAGGLWGGFGWLWTQRRGIVQMYISRINDLVWIDLTAGRPWLISPERPQEFVQALSSSKAR